MDSGGIIFAIPGTIYSGGIETGMVLEWTGTESGGMQLNRFIYLFILQLYFLSLFQQYLPNVLCVRHVTGRSQSCASTSTPFNVNPHKQRQ